jgi:hypothetical protein
VTPLAAIVVELVNAAELKRANRAAAARQRQARATSFFMKT